LWLSLVAVVVVAVLITLTEKLPVAVVLADICLL
jgi:hypothetical protein